MARVRASCPDCGDVEMVSSDIKVRICVDDNRVSYAFRCPTCGLAACKPADSRIVHLLISAGASLGMWRFPAELAEPHIGPPLTHDDLLSFHQLLERHGWFAQLAGMIDG